MMLLSPDLVPLCISRNGNLKPVLFCHPSRELPPQSRTQHTDVAAHKSKPLQATRDGLFPFLPIDSVLTFYYLTGHWQPRRAYNYQLLVSIKLPVSLTPSKLRGRGHSQPKRVSQSGKKSSLSQAVTEPCTFWAVVCSHTIPAQSQPEFLVQISLCLFFPCLLHSCHCLFSFSEPLLFQPVFSRLSVNGVTESLNHEGWKRAPRLSSPCLEELQVIT